MNSLFSKYWWLFLIRGILTIALGVLALVMPITAFTGLALLLGAYMFVDGLFSVVAAVSNREAFRNWTWLLFSGILGILAGAVTFINPFATATALVYLFAIWAALVGVAEIALAIRMRKQMRGEGWYILSGVLTLLFSIYVLFNPIAGFVTLALLFGIYMLLLGTLFIWLALRLRKRRREIPQRY